jgi:hypothetical protein
MIGYYQDKYPRGYVAMRGWDPQNPTKQTIALPVALETDEVTDAQRPEWIWPGHVMFATTDGHWTKTVPADASSRLCVAVAQDASTDWNVLSANSLVGLACSDGFKIATPFFKRDADENYLVGTPLTYCTSADGAEYAGWIKPAATGDTVIGYVAATGGETNGSVNLQPNFVDAQNSMSPASTAFFVIWNTHYSPAAPKA